MKWLACMCVLFVASNATFLRLLEKDILDKGNLLHHGGIFNHAQIAHQKSTGSFSYDRGHQGPAPTLHVFKVIKQGTSRHGDYINNPSADSQVIKVIHQGSATPSAQQLSSSYSHNDAPQVIKVIHQQASSSSSVSGLTSVPISSPAKVIRLIHENAAANGDPLIASGTVPISSPAKVIRLIHENAAANGGQLIASGSANQQQLSPPIKVFRVIHENAQNQPHIQNPSSANGRAVINENNHVPNVPASISSDGNPAIQYPVTDTQNIATAGLTSQHSIPNPTFAIPDIASHVPAPSYGPPH